MFKCISKFLDKTPNTSVKTIRIVIYTEDDDKYEVLIDTHSITKTYLYNFDPHKPHFYIVKMGFTGVYIIFLISAQKHIFEYACFRNA